MKTIQFLLTFIFLFSFSFIFSQDGKMTYSELIKLSKAHLIEMTVKEIIKEHPDFKIQNFDRIRVMKSKDSLLIDFDMSLKFVPLNSESYYRVSKYFGKYASSSYYPLKNPEEYENKEDTKFFIANQSQIKQIEFIKKSIESAKISLFKNRQILDGYTLEVFEQDNFYSVVVESDSATGRFKINKKSGEIYEQSHKHKMKEKESKNDFEEMK